MKRILGGTLLFILIVMAFSFGQSWAAEPTIPAMWWQFQSIDTMKYSRDVSREKLQDLAFDAVINKQVGDIAAAGATHVAIATPYDEEFIPFLSRWVAAARKYGLHVWFRGNWSGWEQWFGYPKISREEHIAKTRAFIRQHADLFVDGDAFSSCPECENGGSGDPRRTGDAAGYRNFLIAEYTATKQAFSAINKHVASNYFSMNGDVARLVMDKPTTAALDGIITIDHYVASPEQLVADINALAKQGGGRVVLGEFGAPIPDIHGTMTQEAQYTYLARTLRLLAENQQLVGLNYWVNVGGSTRLWNDDGSARKAVNAIKAFFTPKIVTGQVVNEIGSPIANVTIKTANHEVTSSAAGVFQVIMLPESAKISISVPGYSNLVYSVGQNETTIHVVLIKNEQSWGFALLKFLRQLFHIRP